jgi:hypothetical protein
MITAKKAAPISGAALNIFESLRLGCRRGFLGFNPPRLALQIVIPAFTFDDFVVLSSHNALLCLYDTVL